MWGFAPILRHKGNAAAADDHRADPKQGWQGDKVLYPDPEEHPHRLLQKQGTQVRHRAAKRPIAAAHMNGEVAPIPAVCAGMIKTAGLYR